jgi:hypothetical protein
MQISKSNRRNLIIGGALLAAVTPSFALLGVGDIVFDPTSYAQLISQATTVMNQLKMMQANVTHFSLKNVWATTEMRLKNTNVRNLFGETNDLSIALSTNSPEASLQAWSTANIPVRPSTTTYLQGQPAGNSTQLSQLAMIETSDAISPDCLTAIGQYRAARTMNATANAALTQQQLDTSTTTNSEVEQLNLLNAAEAQKMTEMQTQGVLQACEASQLTIANMQQRNAAAQDLNTAAFVQQQRAANPVNAANESNTWQNYLP